MSGRKHLARWPADPAQASRSSAGSWGSPWPHVPEPLRLRRLAFDGRRSVSLEIAAFSPFTGPNAPYGYFQYAGCVSAVHAINAAGGVMGHS